MPPTPRGLGVLQIEPTDHCNLACRMCAPHAEAWPSVHGVPKSYLDFARFERIVAGLVAEGCAFDHVILQWLGDPSLHPRLEEMVAVAGALDCGYLRVDSNGILLTEARIERLLALRRPERPLLLVFTVDAATDATYARVKGRDALPRVKRHIRHLLALRRAHPVHVQVQFVVQPENAHEVGDFYRYWHDALHCHGYGHGHAEILFKRLSVSGGAAGQAEADRLYERATAGLEPQADEHFALQLWRERPWQRDDAHAGRGPCPGPWLTPVVRHDGHLLLCCADLSGQLDLGSLDEASFRELWFGPKAAAERRRQLSGRFEGPCAGCGGINWYGLPADAAEARWTGGSQPR